MCFGRCNVVSFVVEEHGFRFCGDGFFVVGRVQCCCVVEHCGDRLAQMVWVDAELLMRECVLLRFF